VRAQKQLLIKLHLAYSWEYKSFNP